MGLPNLNPNNKLICDDTASSIRQFVFDGSNNNQSMAIVQGAKTLVELLINDLFIPLSRYNLQEFTVAASKFVDIDSCNIGNQFGEVQGLVILVEYPNTDSASATIENADKYLLFEYPIGGQVMHLGKIMILTGSTKDGLGWDLTSSPGGLRVSNPHANFDVSIRVLSFV